MIRNLLASILILAATPIIPANAACEGVGNEYVPSDDGKWMIQTPDASQALKACLDAVKAKDAQLLKLASRLHVAPRTDFHGELGLVTSDGKQAFAVVDLLNAALDQLEASRLQTKK